uniref:RPA-interacting protein N-terminal domain-containing protein n=1 Tax=Eptatretus burgeri TaxID=7764 RepID=A0A8C4NCI0_EPTBU
MKVKLDCAPNDVDDAGLPVAVFSFALCRKGTCGLVHMIMEVESNFKRTLDDCNRQRMNVRVPAECAAHVHGHRARFKATSPHWREIYRERCLLRLKNSRASHLDRFRAAGARSQIQMQNGDSSGNLPEETSQASLIEKVLFREWQALKAERQRAQGAPNFEEEEEIEVERATLEEIRKEMLAKAPTQHPDRASQQPIGGELLQARRWTNRVSPEVVQKARPERQEGLLFRSAIGFMRSHLTRCSSLAMDPAYRSSPGSSWVQPQSL